jgi:hypothetical protein
MLAGLGLMVVIQVILGIHVVRTNQQLYWLWIIIAFGPIGCLVYGAAIVLPEMLGGTTARRLGRAARDTLDPTRAYRRAKADIDESPTVANQTRLAQAAAGLGRYDEAEQLYAAAGQGIHAEDPTILLGRANALVELGRFADALPLLDKLGEDPDKGRTPAAALALGRTYEGLGRNSDADRAYEWAAGRLPGLEGLARYGAFLARIGRRDEAQDILKEIDRRVTRTRGQFRAEARAWRDLAAQALA